MAVTTLLTQLKTPDQAGKLFVHAGGFPKQRHTFVARFHTQTGQMEESASKLTFAIKNIDRPSIQPVSEELNQYNKKRHVYTGWKASPIKLSFYDTGDGAALRMWNAYLQYYYGDFSPTKLANYSYDVTTGTMAPGQHGFTAANGGSSFINAHFFFKTVEIIHFYNGVYDLWTLQNPRFVSFDPDDLDFSNSEVSTINASLVYETMVLQIAAGRANSVSEMQAGQPFNGNTPELGDYEAGRAATPSAVDVGSYTTPLAAQSSFTTAGAEQTFNYRYSSTDSGGSLGLFGNFAFGPTSSPVLGGGGALNTVLGLATGQVNGAGLSASLVSGALGAVAGSMPSVGGRAGAALMTGVLASTVMGHGGLLSSRNGVSLPATGYGAINSTGPAEAQYGFNSNSRSDGSSYGGATGASGYLGPNTGAVLSSGNPPTDLI